jgi:hypothetical protein
MMNVDFSSMSVGDEVRLPDATWDDTRHIYEACQEYARKAEPRPQFQFDSTKPTRMRQVEGWFGWIIRRTR